MHSKFGNTTEYTSLHDGPITVCHGHPKFYDFFLTIGGTIYALWNLELKEAVLWKKAPTGTGYYSGVWSYNHPSYFICLRTDGIVEFWDLLFNRTTPIRLVSMCSSRNIFGTESSLLCRKNTFGLSDIYGDLMVLHIPEMLNYNAAHEVENTRKIFDREVIFICITSELSKS